MSGDEYTIPVADSTQQGQEPDQGIQPAAQPDLQGQASDFKPSAQDQQLLDEINVPQENRPSSPIDLSGINPDQALADAGNLYKHSAAYLNTAIKYSGAKLGKGVDGTMNAANWWQAAADPRPQADAEAALRDNEMMSAKLRNADINSVEKTFEWSDIPIRLFGELAQAMPFLGATIGGGIALGGTTAATAGAAGTVLGGPVVGAAAAAQGWETGFQSGAAATAGNLAIGDSYREMIKMGVPRDTAHNYAIGFGLVSAVLTMPRILGFGGTAKAAQTAAITALKNPEMKDKFALEAFKVLSRLGVDWLTQTGLQVSQTVANEMIYAVVQTTHNIPLKSYPEYLQIFLKSLETAMYANAALIGAAHITGHVSAPMIRTGANVIKATKNVTGVLFQESAPTSIKQINENTTPAEIKALTKMAEKLQAAIEHNEEVTRDESDQHLTPQERLNNAKARYDSAKAEEKNVKEQLTSDPHNKDLKTQLKKLRVQKRRASEAMRRARFKLASEQIDTIVEAFKSKFTIEHDINTVDESLADVEHNQNILVELITNSDMADNYKALFIKVVKETQTSKELAKIGEAAKDRVSAYIEKNELKGAKKLLAEVVSKIDAIGKGKQQRSRFDPQTHLQEIFDAFKFFIGDNHQQNAERIANPRQYYDELPETKQIRFDTYSEIARIVGDMSQRDSRSVLDLAQHLQDAIDIGLEGKLAKDQARRQQYNDLVGKVADAVLGRDHTEEDDLPHQSGKPSTFQRWRKTFGHTIFSWEGKLEILFQKVKDFTDLLDEFEVHHIVQIMESNKAAQQDVFMNHLKAATGLTDMQILKILLHGANEKNKTRIDFLSNRKDEHGDRKPGHVEMTRNQLIDLWLQLNDKTLEDGLREGNGYTFSEDIPDGDNLYDLVAKELSDQEHQIAAGVAKFYDKYFSRLAEEYRAETGLDLPKIEGYSGYAQRYGVGGKIEIEQDFTAQMQNMSARSSRPNSTILRTNSKKAVVSSDAMLKVLKHIDQVERYKAWREPSKMFDAVFQDSLVRNVIQNTLGDGMYSAVTEHLKDMTQGNHERYTAGIGVMTRICSNAANAFLGLKFPQYIKQWTAVVNFALHIPSKALREGAIDYWQNKKAADAIIWSNDFMKSRYANFTKNQAGILNAQDLQALAKGKWREAALVFLKMGDKDVSVIGFWATYKYNLSKGKTHEQAIRLAEKAVDTTQSSGRINQLGSLSRSPWTKWATMFTQQPTRLFEFQVNAARKFANHPDKANFGNMMRTWVITHSAQALFLSIDLAYASVMKTEQEKQNAAWKVFNGFIGGPLPSLFDYVLFRGLMEAENNLTGSKQDVFDYSTIPTAAINKGAKFALDDPWSTWQDGQVDFDEVLTMVKDWDRSGNLIVGGIPYGPAIGLIDDVLKNPNLFPNEEGNIGYEYRMAKKRRDQARQNGSVRPPFPLNSTQE